MEEERRVVLLGSVRELWGGICDIPESFERRDSSLSCDMLGFSRLRFEKYVR